LEGRASSRPPTYFDPLIRCYGVHTWWPWVEGTL
jgi:hypothetical protein